MGEISNNWTNVYKTLESCWYLLTILQCINTTSVISKWGTFSLFSYLAIYFTDSK